MALFTENFRSLNGFEELRKYIKHGSEFCKEVANILQERSDLESNYAKNLQRLSGKLLKVTSNNIGTLAEGWKAVASMMEQESELHKNLALAFVEEISKPLKLLVEAQIKARKPIEVVVDKSLKNLTDKRTEEYRAKKSAYACAKDYEKGEESKNDSKAGNKKHSDKDKIKLEKKCDQYSKSLKKADKDYCELCEKAEAARQEWDLNVLKGSAQLQSLEEERISKMSEYLNQYNSHMSVMGPKITQCCDRLNEAVVSVDLQGDLRTIVQQKGSGVAASEQILIDCYAEDMQFSMKPERRKNSLQNYLLFIRQSIERERKGREGVEKLVEVYNQRPGFADPETQIETKQRLLQVTYMMNFLEASHFKLANSFASLDKQQKMEHKFAQYIETTRDKQGVAVSTLRLPANMANEGNSGYDVTSVTLTTLASQGNENETGFADDEFETESIGQCRALYGYEATQHDELTLTEGDIINLYDKQQDGWWQGECGGKIGIFPATYVQEM
ncbi:nostrin-like isoform X2 [Mytilus trossulus]|uniref:nostrin-like isoform X2 n=1 Tax=Mytilus trossulus TaxID=6551 RepID=UPI003004EB11